MEVILDSSFIVSCMLSRIDFISDLEEKGFKIRVPKEVIQELKDLKFKKGQSHDVKNAIDAVFLLFDQRKVKRISIGDGIVDDQLIKKGKDGTYIATLDREIKRSVPNKVFILSSKKGLGVEKS